MAGAGTPAWYPEPAPTTVGYGAAYCACISVAFTTGGTLPTVALVAPAKLLAVALVAPTGEADTVPSVTRGTAMEAVPTCPAGTAGPPIVAQPEGVTTT